MANILKDYHMGKDANKSMHHKGKKVPLKASSKSKIDKCTRYGHLGHMTWQCVVVQKSKKQKKKVFSWEGRIMSSEKFEPRLKRHKPILYDWTSSAILMKQKR